MSAILLDACRAFCDGTAPAPLAPAAPAAALHTGQAANYCAAPCETTVRSTHECRGVGGAQVVGPLGDLEHMRRLLGDGDLLDAGDLVRSAAKPSRAKPSRANRATSRIVSLSISSAPASSRHPPPPHARARAFTGLLSPAVRARSRAVAVLRLQVWLTDKTPHESLPLARGAHRQCDPPVTVAVTAAVTAALAYCSTLLGTSGS